MHPKRLRAPSEDGSLLQDPPLSQGIGLAGSNRRSLEGWTADLQGRRADILRSRAREEAVALARAYHEEAGLDPVPDLAGSELLIATGHQPELFHPGVWVKNFAAAELARAAGGIGLNLIIDNDVPKGAFVRAPGRKGAELVPKVVEFDTWSGEVPFEDQSIRDADRFASFEDRLIHTLGGSIPDPLVTDFWPLVLEGAGKPDFDRNVGLRFARARRLIEARWGYRNLEVPLSRICGSDAFLWFASHIMANLKAFRSTHNDALLRYRKAYGIRSKNHPVAALRRDGDDWQEAPFWVWRASSPRRQALWVRSSARTVDLRIGGEDSPFLTLPLAADREACCAVEALRELPEMGIRLRTRALTTTMFARLFLSDLFLHGIGGAKYDELGDEIVRGFYGIEPPRFLTLSLTLWASLPRSGTSVKNLRSVEKTLRDLQFNPDRHLDGSPKAEAIELLQAKRAAVAGPVETRKQRVGRFYEVRRINEALQPFVSELREHFEARRVELKAELRREAIARSREYASVIHSEARLRSVMRNLTDEIPAQ